MKNHITLLTLGLQVRKTLPVDQVLGTCNSCSSSSSSSDEEEAQRPPEGALSPVVDDKLDEAARWRSQARFWQAVAQRCAESPAIFCCASSTSGVTGLTP